MGAHGRVAKCPLSGVKRTSRLGSVCCDIGAIPSGHWLQFIQDFELQSQTLLVQGRDKHLNDGALSRHLRSRRSRWHLTF